MKTMHFISTLVVSTALLAVVESQIVTAGITAGIGTSIGALIILKIIAKKAGFKAGAGIGLLNRNRGQSSGGSYGGSSGGSGYGGSSGGGGGGGGGGAFGGIGNAFGGLGRGIGKRSPIDIDEVILSTSLEDSLDCAKKLVCLINAQPFESLNEQDKSIYNLFGGNDDSLDVAKDSIEFELAAVMGRKAGAKQCNKIYARCPQQKAELEDILKGTPYNVDLL